jgi:putative uncharacterized protein HI_1484 in Mu-like prophage fluMu region
MENEINLNRLKEAYRFYIKVQKDKDAISAGCLSDAEKWLFQELSALFDEEKIGDENGY